MRKKKILIYINQICLRGGVEKVFYNLISNLDLEKYDITILTTVAYLKDDLKIKIYDDRIKRYFLLYDEFSTNSIKRTYERLYNKCAPKLVEKKILKKKWDIAISAQEGFYAKFISKVNAKKRLLWIHNDFFITDWSKRYFNNSRKEEAECYKLFDKIICVSNSVKKSIESTLGIKNNLIVRYNPIDTNEIDVKVNEIVEEKRSDKLLFLAVGRLCYQKGYDRLVSIVKKLNEDGYDFDLWILGDGEERDKVKEYIERNNIKNIKMLGNKNNPFKYMRIADWILSTSRFEGFNTALQEAAYIGKAIITTNCAGVYELLGDSEFGIVVDNNDGKIYETLKKVLENPNYIKKYEEKITERKAFIDMNERIRKIEELF